MFYTAQFVCLLANYHCYLANYKICVITDSEMPLIL